MRTLSKQHSDLIKGLAILLMIVHHLFRFPERVPSEFPIHFLVPRAPIEYQIGVFGKICVVLFLFVSGYGLGTRRGAWSLRDWSRRMGSFYLLYVVNLVLLGGISWLWFRHSSSESGWWQGFDWSLKGLLGNLFLWNPSYSQEWGFVKIYMVLMLVAWPLCEWLTRFGAYPLMALSIGLYGISGYLTGFDNILSFQAAFVVGFVLSRWPDNAFHRLIETLTQKGKLQRLVAVGVLFLIAFLLRKKTSEQTDWVVALFLVAAMALSAELSTLVTNIIGFLGRHSACMWLNHTFIFYYWFNKPFYSLRYSPLLFLVALATSLALALLFHPLIVRLQSLAFPKKPASVR